MYYRIAADLVLVTHFVFVILVVAGGLAAFRYVWFAWVHIPAAIWGAFVELTGRICPLTILENFLRSGAGQEGYANSFVEQYIVPVIYPAGLTRNLQFVLAGLVVTVNVIIYATIVVRNRLARRGHIRDR
jgi:hypothetical protein